MVRVLLTPDVVHLINAGKLKNFFSESEEKQLDEDVELESLAISSLLALKRYVQENPEGEKSLASCFTNQKNILRFGKKEIPVEDGDAVDKRKERMDHLTRLQQTKEYNQMVFGSHMDPVTEYREKEMSAFVSFRHQASVGANVIISAGGMGVVFFFLARTFLEKKQHCILVGAVGAVLMMIAEMILYIIRAMHIDNAMKESKNQPCSPPPPKQFVPPPSTDVFEEPEKDEVTGHLKTS